MAGHPVVAYCCSVRNAGWLVARPVGYICPRWLGVHFLGWLISLLALVIRHGASSVLVPCVCALAASTALCSGSPDPRGRARAATVRPLCSESLDPRGRARAAPSGCLSSAEVLPDLPAPCCPLLPFDRGHDFLLAFPHFRLLLSCALACSSRPL